MTAVLVLALTAPIAQPKVPVKPVEVAGFGFPADSEFYWPTHLFASADVQKELKVTRDQLARVEGIRTELKKVGEAVAGLTAARAKAYTAKMTAWAEKSLAESLSEEQRARHRQILWQVQEFNGGMRNLANNPVFAKQVGLSADQQQRARKIDADYYAGWQKLVKANPLVGNGPVPGEEALAKKAEDDTLKLLTAEQKKKWNELLGAPFKGDIVQFPIPGIRPIPFKAPAEKK